MLSSYVSLLYCEFLLRITAEIRFWGSTLRKLPGSDGENRDLGEPGSMAPWRSDDPWFFYAGPVEFLISVLDPYQVVLQNNLANLVRK